MKTVCCQPESIFNLDGIWRWSWKLGLPVVIIFFLSQVTPGINWKDSGDLVTSSYFLSTAHPTGYPLYTILGKTFSFIPLGNIAYKLNVFSALSTVVAVYIFGCFAHHILRSRWATLITVFCCIISFQLWYSSTSAEIYGLNLALLSFLCLLAILPGIRSTYLFCLVLGISLGNHLTPLIWVPLFVFLDRKLLTSLTKKWCIFGGLFLLGLSVYLFLPVRSVTDPFPDFGDTQTFTQFLYHVTAKQYKHGMFANSLENIVLERIPFLVFLLRLQWNDLLVFIGIIGLSLALIKKHVSAWICLTGCSGLLVFMLYEMDPNFFSPGYMLFSLLIGYGFLALSQVKNVTKWVKQTIIISLLVISFTATILHNFPYCYKKNNILPVLYGTMILRQVPTNGVIFTETDSAGFIMWYLLNVEKSRQDVLHVHRPALTWGPYYWQNIGFYQILMDSMKNGGFKAVEQGAVILLKKFFYSRSIVWEPVEKGKDPLFQNMYPAGLFYSVYNQPINLPNITLHHNYLKTWLFLESTPTFMPMLQFDPFGQEAFGAATNYAGYLFSSRNMVHDAVKAYERGLKIDPRNINIMKILINLYSVAFENAATSREKKIYLEKSGKLQQKIRSTSPRKYRVFL